MATSKLQRYVSEQLSVFFGGFTIRENVRPEWLLSPDSGRLELDFFIEELDVAIEVQGAQHYKFMPHFHASYDDFLKRRRDDQFKAEVCITLGIQLFEASNKAEADQVIQQIYRIAYQSAIGEVLPEEKERIINEAKKRQARKIIHRVDRGLNSHNDNRRLAHFGLMMELVEHYGAANRLGERAAVAAG